MTLAGRITAAVGIGLIVLTMLLQAVSPVAANVLAGLAWLTIAVGVVLYMVGRRQERSQLTTMRGSRKLR